MKAWVKLSINLPHWPCHILLHHPAEQTKTNSIVQEDVCVWLSGPTGKEFYGDGKRVRYLIDTFHEGQWCKASTVKPFFENFSTYYRAVMDRESKWAHMQDHFMKCVKTLVEDHSIGSLAFILLLSPFSPA